MYLQNLDKSVRPQDDFYRHINGGWLATTQIPADRSNYGTFTKLQEDAERDLHDILEEAAKAKAAPGSDAQKVGDYYASFLDEATVEARGLKPLQDELTRIDALKTKQDVARLHRPRAAPVRRASVRVLRRRRREELDASTSAP